MVLPILCCLMPLLDLHAEVAFLDDMRNSIAEFSLTATDGRSRPETPDKYSRPDTHAPGHLMGGHLHGPGEKMIEYKYMNMFMSGLQQGTDVLSITEIFSQHPTLMILPEKMNMEMHMMHYMVGWKDDVTLYVMPMWVVNTMEVTPYMDNGMGMKMPMPRQRRTNSGFGDLPFGALWRIKNDQENRSEWLLNIGFSAPTGDIDGKTTSPMNPAMEIEFPYPMRLGTGSWMARPGITYSQYTDDTSVGLQLQADIALAKGAGLYATSDKYRLSGWFSKIFSQDRTWAYTLRIEGLWASDYRGADPQLEVMQMGGMTMAQMNPAANGSFQGGQSVSFGYGIIKSLADGSRLNFEIVHPVYQDLHGLQMSTDWSFAASWSKAY